MLSAPLLLLFFSLSAPPGDSGWTAPRFERGHEIPFVGEIVDTSDRPGQKYRNVYELTVSLLVLETNSERSVLAVLTAVTPTADRGIVDAARTVSGEVVVGAKASARVDFIRIDASGVAKQLTIPSGQPPFVFSEHHKTESIAAAPIDAPAFSEFGFFPPRKVGVDSFERNWTREDDALWNGSRMIDLVSVVSSLDYENPAAAVAGWRRSERLYVSPLDGLPRAYARRIEQREGKNVIATVEMRLEMKSAIPAGDAASVRHIRNEAESAAWFASEAESFRGSGKKMDPKSSAVLLSRIKRFLDEHQPPTAFRPAVEATGRLVGEIK